MIAGMSSVMRPKAPATVGVKVVTVPGQGGMTVSRRRSSAWVISTGEIPKAMGVGGSAPWAVAESGPGVRQLPLCTVAATCVNTGFAKG